MVNLYTVLFAKNRYTNLLRVCEGLKAKNISAISLAKLSGEINSILGHIINCGKAG